jgi:hypothetical protein
MSLSSPLAQPDPPAAPLVICGKYSPLQLCLYRQRRSRSQRPPPESPADCRRGHDISDHPQMRTRGFSVGSSTLALDKPRTCTTCEIVAKEDGSFVRPFEARWRLTLLHRAYLHMISPGPELMAHSAPEPMVEPLAPHSNSNLSRQPTTAEPLYELLRIHRDPADRRVMTPWGSGRLCQVFSGRAGVVLDITGRVAFFDPSEIRVAVSTSGPTAHPVLLGARARTVAKV